MLKLPMLEPHADNVAIIIFICFIIIIGIFKYKIKYGEVLKNKIFVKTAQIAKRNEIQQHFTDISRFYLLKKGANYHNLVVSQ